MRRSTFLFTCCYIVAFASNARAQHTDTETVLGTMRSLLISGQVRQAAQFGTAVLQAQTFPPSDRLRILALRAKADGAFAFISNDQKANSYEALSTALDSLSDEASTRAVAEATTQLAYSMYFDMFLGGRDQVRFIRRLAERSDSLWIAVGDARGRSENEIISGIISERAGDVHAAGERYKSALQLAITCDCDIEESYANRHLGLIALAAGRTREANDYLAKSLQQRRAAGFLLFLPLSNIAMSQVALQDGDPASAEHFANAALTLVRLLEQPRIEALALMSLGDALVCQSRRAAAFTHYRQAEVMSRRIGYRSGITATKRSPTNCLSSGFNFKRDVHRPLVAH